MGSISGGKTLVTLAMFFAVAWPAVSLAGARRVADLRPGPEAVSGVTSFHPVSLDGVTYFAERNRLWSMDSSGSGQVVVEFDDDSRINAAELKAFGAGLVFPMSDTSYGFELWRYEPESGSCELVMDIRPGPRGSDPARLLVDGSTLYFIANDGTHGFELWRSDGTPAGTNQIVDLDDTYGPYFLSPMFLVDSTLVFRTGDAVWGTDGTAEGTVMLAAEFPTTWRRFQGAWLLSARGGLWCTDGTASGTKIVLASDSRHHIVNATDEFLLLVTEGGQLLVSGGTEATTLPISRKYTSHINSLAPAIPSTTLGESLLFTGGAAGFSNPVLWITDGTPDGTVVLDEFPGQTVATSSIVAFDGNVYFDAGDEASGQELWRSDGSVGGAELVSDIHRGLSFSGDPASSRPADFHQIGNRLLFAASSVESGRELWATDGSNAELTVNGSDDVAGSRPDLFFAGIGRVIVQGRGALLRGLWGSDGTVDGSVFLGHLFEEGHGLNPPPPAADSAGPQVVFNRWEERRKGQGALWITDGATSRVLRSFGPGATPGLPVFYRANDPTRSYFAANDGIHGAELWVTTGTTEGTVLAADLASGIAWGAPNSMAVLGDTIIASSRGRLVAVSAGARRSPLELLDDTSEPRIFATVGDRVFLSAFSTGTGYELWVTDGTRAGTRLVRELAPGRSPYDEPITWIATENTFFFTHDDGVHGRELWRSDGTHDGTRMVRDIWPGPLGSSPRQLSVSGDQVWFAANDGTHGHELWATTKVGARMIADVRVGSGGSAPSRICPNPSDGSVLFIATDGRHGSEWWISDDSAPGARLHADVWPGPRSGVIDGCLWTPDGLFFTGRDPDAGDELWLLPPGKP